MNIRSANCKFQIDRIDAIFINNDASNLEVKCGEYLFSFDISEVSLIEKMDINSLYLVKEEKDEIDKKRKILFLNIKKDIDKLSSLLNEMTGHWGFEDPIYRFYHESFKVYSIQESTKKICKALQELLPGETLNTSFMKIIELGTNKKFTLDVNQFWFMETLPLTTAFFHARFMLDMVVKYGKELKGQPEVLPSGWASVLYLYNLR